MIPDKMTQREVFSDKTIQTEVVLVKALPAEVIQDKTIPTEVIPSKNGILDRYGVQYIHSLIILQVSFIVIFFIFAEKFDILRAWIYFGLAYLSLFADIFIFTKIIPELANIRGNIPKRENKWEKTWEKVYTFMLIILFATAGLDTGRFQLVLPSLWDFISKIGKSTLILGTLISGIDRFISSIAYLMPKMCIMILGICLFIAGSITLKWSMISNKHFENVVRIQKEKNHVVITTGPYKIVRHPGYLGFIMLYFSMPLIVGSKLAIFPALIVACLYIIITANEDKLLKNELHGYLQYCAIVKYRLIPGIW